MRNIYPALKCRAIISWKMPLPVDTGWRPDLKSWPRRLNITVITMSDDATPDAGGKPRRPLPPELEFLRQPPPPGLEAEELIDHIQQQHARIRQHAALIREYGMDPDILIGFTAKGLATLIRACQNCDAANEKMLGAMADKADAEYNLFKTLAPIAEQAYEINPFDPEVQELKEFVDEWRQQMPKE